jgi:hypothetical protein
VSSAKMTRVVPYSPERAMSESPVPQERHPRAKGQAQDRLVSAQALVARQQTRAGAVTVAVPTMANGGHVRFSMIPRLVFPEYACPPFDPSTCRSPHSTRVQVPVERRCRPRAHLPLYCARDFAEPRASLVETEENPPRPYDPLAPADLDRLSFAVRWCTRGARNWRAPLGNCHQARLSVPLPRLGRMADNRLSVGDRELFLAEPHIAALSVSAGPGRGPLTVPIWYQYAPGGEAWVLTEAGSRKARLIEAARRFTLMVERVMPTTRYVSVEGPVTRTVPGTDELLREIAARYLPPDKVPAYIEFAMTELGEQVAIYLRPERWLTADLGPGAVPPQVT